MIYICKPLKVRCLGCEFFHLLASVPCHVVLALYFIFGFIHNMAIAIKIISSLTSYQCIHSVSKGTLSFIAL